MENNNIMLGILAGIVILLMANLFFVQPVVQADVVSTNDTNLGSAISDGTLVSIDFAHYEIHEGDHYKQGTQDLDLDQDDVLELLFITPDTEKLAHFVLTAQTSDGGASVYFFENVTTSDDGTNVISQNRNRNSNKTSTTLVYTSPTITSTGTKLSEKWIGETDRKANLGGESRGVSEFILKSDTKYLIRLTANADNMKGAIGGDWYEHTFD